MTRIDEDFSCVAISAFPSLSGTVGYIHATFPTVMFFSENRHQFFRPLNGIYREQVVACLRGLYACLYSAQADYSRAYTREQILDVFVEHLTRAPVLDGDDQDRQPSARNPREQAGWILNQLIEHGWIDKHLDEAMLLSSYAFSRTGRMFAQAMVEIEGRGFRTRHRNTRNTLNALRAFLDQEEADEIYNLLDAYEYSERIVSDFSDLIAELDERKRALVREIEAQQLVQRATDEFFDFMEKRFLPDVAIKLSVDSVAKYSEEFSALINRAKKKRKTFKAKAESALRRSVPELLTHPQASIYLHILNHIEARIHSAAEVMLPALHLALNGFTRRATFIIRQLTFSGGQHQLTETCQQLAALDDETFAQRLASAGELLSSLHIGFADPDHIRLTAANRQRPVQSRIEIEEADDYESRKRLFIEQALERAFAVHQREQYEYLVQALANGHQIRSSALPIRDAKELLHVAHIIEAGAASFNPQNEFRFRVAPTGAVLRNDFFERSDEFLIEVIHDAQ